MSLLSGHNLLHVYFFTETHLIFYFRYRVAYDNFISLAYDVYTSHVKHKPRVKNELLVWFLFKGRVIFFSEVYHLVRRLKVFFLPMLCLTHFWWILIYPRSLIVSLWNHLVNSYYSKSMLMGVFIFAQKTQFNTFAPIMSCY